VTNKEIVIFGGFDLQYLNNSFLLVLEGRANFKINTEKPKKLQNADIIMFNGGIRLDIDKSEYVICGQDYVHRMDDKTLTFETVA